MDPRGTLKLYEKAVNSPQREMVDGVGHGEKRFDRRTYIAILLKNPHFLFLIDAKNAFDSNMKVARDKFSSTLVLTRENKLLLALKRGSESAFSSERRAD